LDGECLDHVPARLCDAARVVPIYEDVQGRCASTHGARSWEEVPAAAQRYVRRIEQLAGVPIVLLGTSPQRDDTIVLRDPFDA
jgi:adenylosuccinate synthase